ncbi:MAG TPA: DoxX family protein [Myxococcaceae bacterium]|nr:DoxX family protein [Myxococcaceae bacterium]
MATLRDRALLVHRFVVDTVRHLDWLPSLLARVTLGVVFIQSGWGKLHNLPKVIAFFTELGLPRPDLQAPFVAGTEFVCGWLVLLGLFARIASVPLVVTMLVATVTAKADELKHYGDLFGFTEWTYLALAVVVIVQGAGATSLDALLARVLGLSASSPAEEKRYTVLFGRGLAAGFAAAMVIVTAWWFGARHNPCDQVKDARFAEIVKTSNGEDEDAADEAKGTCKKILGWQKEGKDPAAELKKEESSGDEGGEGGEDQKPE